MEHGLTESDLDIWQKVTATVSPLPRNGKAGGHSYSQNTKKMMCFDTNLDLHGYTIQEAHDAFLEFVEQAYNHKIRKVLIITGCGNPYHSIKRELFYWIEKPEFSKYVKEITFARDHDGGQGAFYVLIHRQ